MLWGVYSAIAPAHTQLVMALNNSSCTEASCWLGTVLCWLSSSVDLEYCASCCATQAHHWCRPNRGLIPWDWWQDLGVVRCQAGSCCRSRQEVPIHSNGGDNCSWQCAALPGKLQRQDIEFFTIVNLMQSMWGWGICVYIWWGKTLEYPGMNEDCMLPLFSFSFFSLTLFSTSQWIAKIVVLYVEAMCVELKLPLMQWAILLLDCSSVHHGGPFWSWLKKTYPFMLLQFVPGGCKSYPLFIFVLNH